VFRLRTTTALLATLAVPCTASAQDRTLSEALSAPEQAVCLSRETLAESVEGWLGHAEVDPSLSILLVLEDGDEREGVSFVVLDGERTLARRRFERLPSDCPDRRAALGLAIAIAIDATILDALGVMPAGARSEDPPETAAPAAEPEPRARRRRARPRPSDGPSDQGGGPRPAVSAYVALLVGALPRPVLAGGASVELRFPEGWALGLRGVGTAQEDVDLGRGVATAQLAYGVADACLLGSTHHLVLDGCAGVLAGRVAAAGRGYAESRETQVGWIATVLRLALRWPRNSPAALVLGFEGWLSVLRPRLLVSLPSGRVQSSISFPVAGIGIDAGLWLGF